MFVSWLAAIGQAPTSPKRFIYIPTLFINSGALETSQAQHKHGCPGGGVDAIIAPIVDLLSRKHWLSMWHGLPQERTIKVKGNFDPQHNETGLERLRMMDDELFRTKKYRDGPSQYLTVFTRYLQRRTQWCHCPL
jgi:hypothetical protein